MVDAPAFDITRFPYEPIDLLSDFVEWNNNPASYWLMSGGHLLPDHIHAKPAISGGRGEYAVDRIKARANIIDDADRYNVDETITSSSYRKIGTTTTSVRSYRIVGSHSDTGEYTAISHHTQKTMSAEYAKKLKRDVLYKQALEIQLQFDILMFLAWTQSQEYSTSGAQSGTETAAEDGVTEYIIQTDLSSATQTDVDNFFAELIALQTKLKKDGDATVDRYTFSVPLEVKDLLQQYKSDGRRLIDPGSAANHHITATDAFNEKGLFVMGMDDVRLGQFTGFIDPDIPSGNGTFGYLHNRNVIDVEFEDYNRPEFFYGKSAGSAESIAFTQMLNSELEKAQMSRDMRKNAIIAAKIAKDGFGSVLTQIPMQMFHLMTYPLEPLDPYSDAYILDHFSSPVRRKGSQLIRLRFAEERLPAPLSTTPIPVSLPPISTRDSVAGLAKRLTDNQVKELIRLREERKDYVAQQNARGESVQPCSSTHPQSSSYNAMLQENAEREESIKEARATELPQLKDSSSKSGKASKYVTKPTDTVFDATKVK